MIKGSFKISRFKNVLSFHKIDPKRLIERDLQDREVINKIKNDEKISNILSDKNLLKHIIVKNRLVNLIVK